MERIRVAVAGATGKTGRAITRALMAADDVELVAALGRSDIGEDVGRVLAGEPHGAPILADLERLFADYAPGVLVDFTHPEVAGEHALLAVARGVHPVVGTTAVPEPQVAELAEFCRNERFGAVMIPNFSLGAMLLLRFARQAAELYDEVELVEGHHAEKVDAPSGTARQLGDAVAAAMGRREIPTHSLRLTGLVADHQLIFGSPGETLTLSHRTVSREAFAPGVLLAVRRVAHFSRLITDVETLLA